MRIFAAACLLFLLCTPVRAAEAPKEQPAEQPSAAELVAKAKPVSLPADIVWETNNDEPLIGSPKALKGGRYNVGLGAYPLTFRIMGPNHNDYFAAWNGAFASAFSLVTMHPTTDKFIPIMATHWSVQKDQQTIYFKLDPDARFSDGHPITADDYVFTWRMMQSKFIVDPFYNSFAERYYTSVDKVDDYTLRIVGTRPSWRPLYDYAGLWPTPRHVTQLDKDWV
ncbi:MAG: ABC transporter substrate-binding protein, partial [Rhodospirillaceae bacterium]